MVKRRAFPPETPYLVAAIDANHGGQVATARRLVARAAAAGAHAVKVAIRRTSETMAPELQSAPWPTRTDLGRTRDELWRALELGPRALAAVRQAARGRVAFVAAPHDLESLKIARGLRPDAYQIDAGVLGDRPVVRAIGRTHRPVLVVAGTCTDAGIAAALRELTGTAAVVVLHTVTAVPLAAPRARLGYLASLRDRFKRPVGYLGWEPGTAWSLVAAALGAEVIEKPFTLDRSLEGPLHAWSLDPEAFATLAAALRDLPTVVAAQGRRTVLPEELEVMANAGHSLVARRRLPRGTRLRAAHFAVRAPMGGLSPRLLDWIDGRRLLYDLKAGEPVTFGLVE